MTHGWYFAFAGVLGREEKGEKDDTHLLLSAAALGRDGIAQRRKIFYFELRIAVTTHYIRLQQHKISPEFT